ncbi:MAG: LacI family transcriptional regulator [Clostridiales bacterium]|jgi:DNA-binding LacI/PurR family transcriptional regulator|nr:LacI family transcriptional regulator [Clostridiales bacterium]
MRRKVTISQVAQIAGVSTTTVSRVMSRTGRISQATREKVSAIIERLEYQPSAIAKGLIESKTYNIGLVLSDNTEDYSYYENNFMQLFIQGAHSYLNKNNYDIVVIEGHENDEKFLEKIIKKQKFDGLILLKNFNSANNILKLKKMSFPFVVIGKPNIPNVNYIDINNYDTVYNITSRLIKSSGSNIGFMGFYDELFQNKIKISALKAALSDNKLAYSENLIYMGKNIFERQAFLKSFTSVKSNKSIICADNASLIYLLDFCKTNKVAIPDNLQVVTFSGSEFLKLLSPPISAVECSAFEIGQKAAILIHSILNKIETQNYYIVENQINYRQSTLSPS